MPRDEPFHSYANRPYTVFGQTYVPVVNNEPTKERGIASWYGRKFHGQKTSSGEIYDMFAMTAAHKTLPIPSYARVTNVKTGQSVVVRINDRGPFHADRIIDLSYAAAARIGVAAAGSGAGGRGARPRRASVRPLPAGARRRHAAAAAGRAQSRRRWSRATGAALYLQLGAFSSRENAESFREHVARDLPWMLEPIDIALARRPAPRAPRPLPQPRGSRGHRRQGARAPSAIAPVLTQPLSPPR